MIVKKIARRPWPGIDPTTERKHSTLTQINLATDGKNNPENKFSRVLNRACQHQSDAQIISQIERVMNPVAGARIIKAFDKTNKFVDLIICCMKFDKLAITS